MEYYNFSACEIIIKLKWLFPLHCPFNIYAENDSQEEESMLFHTAARSKEKSKTSSWLGVLWDGQANAFTFRNEIDLPCDADAITKRTLIHVSASTFDLLGFLSSCYQIESDIPVAMC